MDKAKQEKWRIALRSLSVEDLEFVQKEAKKIMHEKKGYSMIA